MADIKKTMDHTIDSLCPGCFADKGQTNPCPHCGYDEGTERGPLPLPHRSLLHGQYVVGRVLGKPGGFGITYLGWDLHLQTRVAIKEYLPRELAGRSSDRASVAVHSQDEDEAFRFGLEQFLREARTLAQLDHPNIVRVRHFFEANGTAYLVMDYYQGLSLAEYVEQQGGRLAEETARQLMLPILDGLRAAHAKNILHRDIKPQNLYLARLESGGVRPILLDFGAARQAMGEHSRSLSVVLTPGYAPFEQYHRRGKQGPWTDIYAAAAVLYRLVTGEAPPEATERREEDELQPAARFGVSPALSDALAAGLAITPDARPQTVQAFYALLTNAVASPGAQPLPTSPPVLTSQPDPALSPRDPAPDFPNQGVVSPSSGKNFLPVLGVAFLLVIAGGGGYWLAKQPETPVPSFSQPTQVAPPVASSEPHAPPATNSLPTSPSLAARQIVVPEMVTIPAGSFQMGSPASEPERFSDEGPQHQVKVEAFELGKTEVTVAQFHAFADATNYRTDAERDAGDKKGCWTWEAGEKEGSYHAGLNWRNPGIVQGKDDPVVCLSWNDAQAYLAWLKRETGQRWRLPTEAEWEYAARAGTTTPFSTGACITTRQANYNGNYNYNNCGAKTGVYVGKTQPVKSYPANPWGLYDLHGNVWEWVEDCYHDSYQGAPTDGSAWTEVSCPARVLRGGSWSSSLGSCAPPTATGTFPATGATSSVSV